MSNQKRKIYNDPSKAVDTTTGVEWDEGEYVRVSNTLFGDDTDTIIFNMEYIKEHNPELAKKLSRLQDEVKDITWSSKFEGHEEDIPLVKHQFQKIAWEAVEEREKDITR